MKIFPRLVNIEQGKDVYELSIRNSADDERILLFKIRRSEQKMVEFKPKVGYVEPGQTTKVTLRLIDGSIPKTRLLVKLVVLKKSLLEQDFEQSWSVASQRNGEVKKVIDIVHTTSALGTQETAAANSTSVHSPLAHKRNSAKQLLLHRVRSTDSDACWDGASDTSSLSMQQSVTSAAFFSPSPSISAASTPKQSEFNRKQYTGNRFSPDERNQSEGPDTENGNGNFESPLTGEGEVRGGLHSNEYNFNDYEDMERDGYSVAESVADQSVDLHCFSESLSQSQQLQLQDATAALLRGNRSTTANVTGTANTTTSAPAPTTSAESSSAPTPSVATAATTAAATAADGAQDATAVVAVEAGQQKVLLEMLIKLSQTPNTATLLSQLLITAAASQNSASLLSRNHSANGPNLRTLNKPAPSTHQHSSSSAIPNLAAEQGKTFNNALSSPAFTSEQLSRFIEGEHAEFPSIRAASAEEKSESKSEAQDASPVLLASAEAGDEAELTDEQVQECSRLTTLSSADQRARRLRDLSSGVGGGDDMSMSSQSRGVGLRSAYLLELFGEPITNTTFAKVMECRMEQATVEKGKVVAVEVVSAGISDLSNTFGRVFSTAQVSAPAQSDPLDQLRTLRAAYLEDHLKHLTVNDCPRLVELDASLNRFRCLTVLNLSNCRIRTLSAPLNLPLLRSLDLSGNQLASLDYLQLLVSLTTLLAGGNLIASLNLSVNMLVSLSKSLVTLDLSANPVCDDQHYAQEVLHVLPRLRYFDSFDLQQMGKNYSYAYTSRAGSASRRQGAAASTGGTGGRSSSGAAGRGVPDLPEELRSVSVRSGASSSTLSRADRRREFERRLNTAIGLRQRHHQQQHRARTGTPSPSSVLQSADAAPTAGALSSKAGVRPHSASRYHRGRGRSEVAAGDSSCAGYYEDNDYDDEDTEIQSVEDSIHQLSSSLRSSSGNYNRDTSRERDKVQAGFGREEQEGAVSGSSALNPNTNLVHVGAGTTRTSITGTSTGGTSRSRSPSPSLIRHWAEASAPVQEVSTSSQAMLSVPLIDEHSGLLEPTMSIKNRQMYYGVANRRQRFPTHDQNASYTTPYSTATLGSSADLKNHHQFSREGARSPGSLSSSAMNIHLDTSTGGANIGAGVGAGFHSHSLRGYFSDGEVSSSARRRGSAGRARKAATVVSLSEEQFLEMQEEEKYGAWHPRYRVPKPIFGFSRPFIHRRTPHLKDHAPLFNTTVQRMRDSFRKAPARGTFTRAGKGLPGEWYPMDYSDVEAIRRQGYFHDTIGEVTKDSYRDGTARSHRNRSMSVDRSFASHSQSHNHSLNQSHNQGHSQQQTAGSGSGNSHVAKFLQEALVSPKGSVSISPSKHGRRQTWGPHMSRYDTAVSVIHAADDFSDHRKWHQGLFEEENPDFSAQINHPTGSFSSFDLRGLDRSAFSVSEGPPLPAPSSASRTSSSAAVVAGATRNTAPGQVTLDMQSCFEGADESKNENERDNPATTSTTTTTTTTTASPVHPNPRASQDTNARASTTALSLSLPELRYDTSPKDLKGPVGAGGRTREAATAKEATTAASSSPGRQVTLLPMEVRDSGELRRSASFTATSASAPIMAGASSLQRSFSQPNLKHDTHHGQDQNHRYDQENHGQQQHGGQEQEQEQDDGEEDEEDYEQFQDQDQQGETLDASFVDELKMFEALPAFPAELEASLTRYEHQHQQQRMHKQQDPSDRDGREGLGLTMASKISPIKPHSRTAFQPARHSSSPKQPTSFPGQSEVEAPVSPVAVAFKDMSQQIAAEEEELSNYLAWLENQHQQRTGTNTSTVTSAQVPAPVPPVPPVPPAHAPAAPSVSTHSGNTATGASWTTLTFNPAVTGVGRNSSGANPSPSGIPRYTSQSPAHHQRQSRTNSSQNQSTNPTSSRSSSGTRPAAGDIAYEEEIRVFSPRDAAMRAEQQERADSGEPFLFEQGKSSLSSSSNKSSAAMRTLFR